jgi:uncharacterized repeat protein (TIGR03837 family)
MQWDLFCRVIDNFGDIGVCWRLAADLATRGESVRLWADDTSALAWMAPQGAPGVQVHRWSDAARTWRHADVVIEAFGCELPAEVVSRMAALAPPPVWINLEYLSAEPYVERSHGLTSPQLSGPGAGLVKHFYYPGFTAGAGGLLREVELTPGQAQFDATAWLHQQGAAALPGERRVSLFCYDEAPIQTLLRSLSESPTLLLLTPGPAQRQLEALAAGGLVHRKLRLHKLPYLSQKEFDHLLWACDLNFVRGEDSFVRALWAGHPFVWNIYPQHDGAHLPKLQAFLDLYLRDAPESLALPLRRLWAAWNRVEGVAAAWPEAAAWQAHALGWCERQRSRPDLATQLIQFVAERR